MAEYRLRLRAKQPGRRVYSECERTDHRQLRGDVANFNAGAKTGETNNLFFIKATAKHPKVQFPSVYFEMASKAGKTASCVAVKGQKA